MNFLLLIKLFETTGSTIATSLLWVAYALPAIIVGPFASASLDMVDKKKVLMLSNLFQAVTIILYSFVFEGRLFLPYGVVMIYSMLNQFYLPAEAASLPTIVSKRSLPHANGLFFLTQIAALILGFGTAGLLKQTFGFQVSLTICAALLMTAFLSVSFLPKMDVDDSIPKEFEKAMYKFFTKIKEGYEFIRGNSNVLAPFLILIGLQVSVLIGAVITPALTENVFGAEADAAGVLIIVPAAIGGFAGALVIPKLLKMGVRKRYVMQTFMLTIGATLVTFALVIPHVVDYQRTLLGVITLGIAGFSFVGILIPAQTFLQEVTPEKYRGRVFGNFWFIATALSVIPVLSSGAFSEIFGVRALLTLMGILALIMLFVSRRLGGNAIKNKPLLS
jgi:MFS family permease